MIWRTFKLWTKLVERTYTIPLWCLLVLAYGLKKSHYYNSISANFSSNMLQLKEVNVGTVFVVMHQVTNLILNRKCVCSLHNLPEFATEMYANRVRVEGITTITWPLVQKTSTVPLFLLFS